ncbi:hypothetical protein Poly24_15830 [Rosistilla carotiformis]|uniref:DUF1559 domain-containing protein n=1 Tax=Rosistilla carotiformis TaxID=2528017 RepID=A0A518JQS3_9BACT|nr:DUF1559 domain-containing protein [Rosistilla carotiformis]QDV67878.1 hypothetical protein Poly24_15830 [Rosistilla carotiformis]
MSNQPPNPSLPPNDPHYQQWNPPAKKNNTVLIIVLALVGLGALPCLGICAGLLLPAVQAAREAARRVECSNNIKQIALAMHNYHDAYQAFPPAFTVDEAGQPLHSWRTLILPFLEQKALYDQIDLNKPWDDPANQQVASTVIKVFGCPSATDHSATGYVAVVDPSGAMTGPVGTRFRDILDGSANTILFVEVGSEHAVPWMSPHDIDLATFESFAGQDRQLSNHPGGTHVSLCDGAVRFLANSTDAEIRRSLITKAGNERVTLP